MATSIATLLILGGVAGVAVMATGGGKKSKRSSSSGSTGPFIDRGCTQWRPMAEQVAWSADVLNPILEEEIGLTTPEEWRSLPDSGHGYGSVYEKTISMAALVLARSGLRQCSPWTGSPEKRFLFKSVWCQLVRRLIETHRIPPVGDSTVEETLQLITEACSRSDFDPLNPETVEGLEQ